MYSDYVNVFCGSGDALLPQAGSLCAKWFFIKAQCGNTCPHAALPFSMLSAGAYSGGYPTGYGVNAPNYNGQPGKLMERLAVSGFTHFHHSGTGAIEAYYNYFRVVPLCGSLAQLDCKQPVREEDARPGYYALTLENGVEAELTVGAMAARHRYHFPDGNGRVAVDFAHCGLDKSFEPKFSAIPQEIRVVKTGAGSAEGYMKLYDLTLYVSICCTGAASCALFAGEELCSQDEITLAEPREPGGAVFMLTGTAADIVLGFSYHSPEQARAHRDAMPAFDAAAASAETAWEDALSAMQAETPNERLRDCFYSMLYHSLLKPALLEDPSPYNAKPRYYMDFSTLWDQYKTLFPLILTFYPQQAAEMLNSLLDIGEKHGILPCCIILNNRSDMCDMQARMLAAYILCSAYAQKIAGIDYPRALAVLLRDLKAERNAQFLENGYAQRYTHILDLADGCFYLAALAGDLGESAIQVELQHLAAHWRNAYDSKTGLLSEKSEYYEGTAANYSFRLLHDMEGRAALFPSRAAFEHALDRFFGFREPDCSQQADPRDVETMWRGMALGRFEGFNNEPDMETPYNYLFVGRHDKLCEILSAGMAELFSCERRGLPGNNDSGGLSSCYIWNTLGIFPAFASRLFLIGRPFFERVKLRLSDGKQLQIIAYGLTEHTQYVKQVRWNGTVWNRFWLTSEELLHGGTLEFTMSEQPCDTSDYRVPTLKE